jgi:acylphosphatase
MRSGMNVEVIELHLIVRGEVQGVGYRAIVQEHARALKLLGTVCNLSDGSVEIFVHGPPETVAQFLQLIRHQIGFAQVRDIAQKQVSPLNQYINFTIIRNS